MIVNGNVESPLSKKNIKYAKQGIFYIFITF